MATYAYPIIGDLPVAAVDTAHIMRVLEPIWTTNSSFAASPTRDKAADAVRMINSGIEAWQSIGSKLWMPNYLSQLAMAHAGIGQLNDAWRRIGEAMTAVETTKEGLWEAEVHRIAGYGIV